MNKSRLKQTSTDLWSAENKSLAFLLVVACLSKLIFFADITFWLDEQISIAIAGEGVMGCVPAALRFSAHPPAYYCQLGAWTLFGKNDFWLMANAIFLNLVAVFLLYRLTRQRYGLNIALFAALTMALLPQFTYYAANVRMYSWIIIFTIVIWNFTEQIFDTSPSRRERRVTKTLRWRMLSMLLLGYAHAIGPLYAVMQAIYAFWLAMGEKDKSISWKWFRYEALTGVLLLPVVINGVFRETQHQNADSGTELIRLFAENFASDIFPENIYGWVAVLVVMLLILFTYGIREEKQDLKRTLVLVFGQILFFILVSIILKPVLSSRGLVTVLPAFCLLAAIAQAKVKGGKPFKHILLAVWFGLLSFGSYQLLDQYKKPNDYAGVVEELGMRIADTDSVYVYAGATHWGIARAMQGADWGSALEIQAPSNERWQQLENALGGYCHTFMICAERNYYDWKQSRVYIFHDQMMLKPTTERIWLIHNAGQNIEYVEEQLESLGYVIVDEQNHDAELIKLFKQKAF